MLAGPKSSIYPFEALYDPAYAKDTVVFEGDAITLFPSKMRRTRCERYSVTRRAGRSGVNASAFGSSTP